MTVRDLLARLSSDELTEWMGFDLIHPFGEPRADLRAALVACTVANAFRAKGPALKVEDFMPDFTLAAEEDGIEAAARRAAELAKAASERHGKPG